MDAPNAQDGDTPDEEAPLTILEHTPETTKSLSLLKDPWMWSISFEQLLQIRDECIEYYGPDDFPTKTMRDVHQHKIVPVCEQYGTSYALHLNPEGLLIHTFVTHCWDEPFGDFVASIEANYGGRIVKPNLWICAFALMQGDDALIVQDQLNVQLEETPFVLALRKAASFLVVRNAFTDLYTRIWCVYELFLAKEIGLVPNQTFVVGPNTFANAKSSCLDARASNYDDKARILKALTASQVEYKEVDSFVNQFRSHEMVGELSEEEKAAKMKAARMRQRRIICYVSAALVAVFVIALVVGLVVGGSGRGSSSNETPRPTPFPTPSPTHRPTPFPTPLPTQAPTPLGPTPAPSTESELIRSIQALSPGTSFGNSSSPQSRALEWIKDDPYAQDLWTNQELDRWMQRFAVVTLFYATGSRLQGDWLTTDDECRWGMEGVGTNGYLEDDITCNDNNGKITSLGLGGEAIVGTIPAEVGLLTSLEQLIMAGNGDFLSGKIPSEIGSLSKLTFLNLGGNNLSGTIPTELGNLPSLEWLFLPANRLFGSIPYQLYLASNLIHLWLERNSLQGTFPSLLRNLSNLQSVYIYENFIIGSIPSQLCDKGVTVRIDCGEIACTGVCCTDGLNQICF